MLLFLLHAHAKVKYSRCKVSNSYIFRFMLTPEDRPFISGDNSFLLVCVMDQRDRVLKNMRS